MTTLIIKSKIWNKSNTPLINYKEKNFIKQKITVEKTGILSRNKDKITFKQTENLNSSNNSSDNTNYMNEPRSSELISIEKNPNETNFYVNCGDWSKDLTQLIDQNAVYFLYKGLTIENFLKEKQKYYVLNQGDIIRLGKIYLKILHIKLSGPNKKEDEDEKEKANATTDKEHSDMNKKVVSDNSGNENSESDDEENEKESDIKNEVKKEEDEDLKSEVIKRNNIPFSLNSNYNNKKKKKEENNSNLVEPSEPISNSINYKNQRKINKSKYNNRYDKLNRSFNGNISDNNLEQKIKENINIKRSMSFTLKKSQSNCFSMSLRSFFKSNNNLNQNYKKKSKKFKKKDKIKKLKAASEKQNEKEIIKPQEKKEKGKICRICLSSEDNPEKNPLICPCTCKGSMKFIHYFCLKNWLNLKVESDLGYGRDLENEQPTITYSTKDIACELCKTKLPDYIKHKGKIYNVSFYKPKYAKFIVLESIRDDNRRTKFIHIIPLTKRQIIKIGRLNNCDLSLPDFSISRVHCCMYIESGQLFLENNSKFGTKILVQTSKLTMSPQYPLCIEVQKTYLKLKIQKPFSLFSCCNVYTTSMSKMLVYQKQNERGFDLFCSMVFKEDDGEEEEKDEINSDNNINNEEIKADENKTNNKDNNNEENKKNEFPKSIPIKNENTSEKNTNLDLENKDTDKEIVKKIKLNNKENEFDIKKEITKEKETNIENKNKNEDKNIINIINESTLNKNNIKNEKKFEKKESKNSIKNEKLSNNAKKDKKKEALKVEETNKKNTIEYNNKKEKKLENKNENKKNTDMKLNKSKTIQKNLDNNDIKNMIDSEFKMNGRRTNQKNEFKKTKSLINTEFKNFDKKIMKKVEEKEKDKKEEKLPKIKEDKEKILNKQYSIKNKENQEEKKIKNELNRQDTTNNQDKKSTNQEREKNEKKELDKNIINEEIKDIEKIKENKNKKEIDKNIINEEKKEITYNTINEEKKEIKNKENKNKIIEKENPKQIKEKKYFEQNKEKELINEKLKEKNNIKISENKLEIKENNTNITQSSNIRKNSKNKTQRKIPLKSIDLEAINDLSYKQGPETIKNKNSALDNYQSIFGLMPSKQNESSMLLAPKHTNKNIKKFDLNANPEQLYLPNNSNINWNKYTCQYEENKRMKES